MYMFAGVDKADFLDHIVAEYTRTENPKSDFLDHTVTENSHAENPVKMKSIEMMNSASN